ncbi:uncharacterized protein LOC143217284 isoform X2 [Lasioglossum baleicum]|uniref:uncharacterized protein LOC143217284 isoform X2 n=1 Tax=Lasioglossum baleicum TaxID=434251 RepID=UPI003FCD058B
MTSFYDSHDYYKKMLELQEKLRKSEEERIRLEERFKVLLQESRNRYIEFLEEQRTTDERNHKLLDALDRVDNSLALMTARTDRLNSLRKHYEAYLRGICTVHTDGVDGISGQQSDKYVRTEQRNSLASEAKSTLPLQSSRSNYQPIHSSFLSPSKLAKPTQKSSLNNASSSNVDLRTPSQQTNNDQSVLRTYRHDFEQLPTFHLTSPVFQQSQEYNNNVRFEARDFQTDPKLQSLHANISTHVPHLSMPYYSNGNRPLDTSQNQMSESILQYPINSARMQSFPLQQSSEVPFDRVKWRMKSDDFQNAPKSMERNVNFDVNPHANYLNYSFSNNERDKTTDTFPRYRDYVNARQLSKDTRQKDGDQAISMTTDSEFDKYIDRIRKLHRDLDKQSFEEDRHRQDANSGSLDATVLNNDPDKSDESLTNKVKQVLQLAENLVSRTMNNMNETKCAEPAEKAEQKDCELGRTVQSCAPVSEKSHVEISDSREGRATPTAHANDRISNEIALHQPELDLDENIEKSKNLNFAQEQRKQCLPELQIDNPVHSSQDNRIYVADESELEQCLFSVGEELEPWNLNCVEKQVQEIDLINDIRPDQTVEKDLVVEVPASDEHGLRQIELDVGDNQLDKDEAGDSESVQEVMLNDASGIVKSQSKEYFEASRTKDEDNEISASELRASEKEDANSLNTENSLKNVELPNAENMAYNVELPNTENMAYNVELPNAENMSYNVELSNAELADNKYVEQKDYDADDDNGNNYEKYNESNDQLDVNEDNKPANITMDEERSSQDYIESDKAKEYPNLNEEYNYDQNESYEYDKKQEYEEYVDQEYPQETNEQYEGYTSEQYDQYINNPENIYETDPNAQYQEDANQKYSYPYNANQEFVADENQQYEPKEAEIPRDEHETKQEDSEEYTEDQKESENQGEDVLRKVDEDQSEKLPSTNEKKKVKDVIKSLLDTDTDSTLEQNISTTESDFDFN